MSAYISGTINIPVVTGDIVITASASAGVVTSISAVYTQSGTVYDTDTLDSLRDDLVVTATYEGGTTGVVTTYTLSGTLTAGTSTITVTYGSATDTFSVTVTRNEIKVFVGKGVSGASIIDNANRALSEPVAFTNVAPISMHWPTFSNTKVSFKNTVTNVDTIDTSQCAIAPASAVGQTSLPSGYDGWLSHTDKEYLLSKPNTKWQYLEWSTTTGYMRLLFANYTDMTLPISETIEGVIYINDIPYHLVEDDIENFE